MLFFIICLAVSIIIGILIAVKDELFHDKHWIEYIYTSFSILILSAGISLVIFLGISKIITNTDNIEIYDSTKTKLCSLKDTSSIEGKFFLIGGHVKEKLEYRYFVNDNSGRLTYKHVDAEDVRIDYSLPEGETPYIEEGPLRFKDKRLNLWFSPVGELAVIHIHKENVTFEYEIDLE